MKALQVKIQVTYDHKKQAFRIDMDWNGIWRMLSFSEDLPTSLLPDPSLDHTLSQDKRSQTQDVGWKYKGPGGPSRLREG